MDRKDDHIRVCLEEQVDDLGVSPGFDEYRFDHDALPELNLEEVSTHGSFLGKTIEAPFMIGAMTGGTAKAGAVNRILAEAAERTGIPMALGSQRPMLESSESSVSYSVRDIAPTIPILGNIGAVQLNYGVTAERLNEMIAVSGVDALMFHINPLQEAIQPGGDTRFKGLLDRLRETIPLLSVPAFVKEVGSGFSETTATKLQSLPISGVEIAGVGGTSWSKVEAHRTQDSGQAEAGMRLATWGMPTAESIQIVRNAFPEKIVISSGGVRSGLDIAKSIALGADMGAMAKPFLQAAQDGVSSVIARIEALKQEIRIIQFVTGASIPEELRTVAVLRRIGRRGPHVTT